MPLLQWKPQYSVGVEAVEEPTMRIWSRAAAVPDIPATAMATTAALVRNFVIKGISLCLIERESSGPIGPPPARTPSRPLPLDLRTRSAPRTSRSR